MSVPLDHHTNDRIVIASPKKYVGCYDIGEVEFWVDRRPSAFQQWFIRALLGWRWQDKPELARYEKKGSAK